MTELEKITEPVTRPDGGPFYFYRTADGGVVRDGPYSMAIYTRDEVLRLGNGDFSVGLARIGEASYKACKIELMGGSLRPLHRELEENFSLNE